LGILHIQYSRELLVNRILSEEQKARKNEYNRQRYALERAENLELAREKDRLKAAKRRHEHRDKVRETDRLRYVANREKIIESRRLKYAANEGGVRDKLLAYQRRRFSEGSMRYRLMGAVNSARARAYKRGIPFSLSYTDLGSPTHCAVSGVEFVMSESFHKGNIFCPSLDRIDPTKGYVKGNVRVVCHGYNLAKHEGTDADVLKLARAIVAKADSSV
jgi:hypothetical protein